MIKSLEVIFSYKRWVSTSAAAQQWFKAITHRKMPSKCAVISCDTDMHTYLWGHLLFSVFFLVQFYGSKLVGIDIRYWKECSCSFRTSFTFFRSSDLFFSVIFNTLLLFGNKLSSCILYVGAEKILQLHDVIFCNCNKNENHIVQG